MIERWQVFNDLVRSQIELWNLADERLQHELGVSIGICGSLRAVADTAPSRVQDVAAQLVITIGGASKAVDRLVAQGLCVRKANPDDRRSSIVELTPAGEDLLTRSNAVLERLFGEIFGAALSEPELERLQESLRKVRAVVPTIPQSDLSNPIAGQPNLH